MDAASLAAFSRVAALEQEVKEKDAFLQRASAEAVHERDQLERVIRELVTRNQALEADLSAAAGAHERDVAELLKAHEDLVAELAEARRQAGVHREAQNTSAAQLATAAAVNRELTDEAELLRGRIAALEAQLEHTRQAAEEARHGEGDARADIDDLMQRLVKAEEHIHTLTEEAAGASVTASRLKALSVQLQAERDAARRDGDELVQRLAPAVQGLAADVTTLMEAIEGALRIVEGAAGGSSEPPQLWPMGGAMTDASRVALAVARTRDVLQLQMDGLAVVTRALTDSVRRCEDEDAATAVIHEALAAERAHVAELAAALAAGEARANELDGQATSLKAALQESAQWMAEAAQIGEERSRRVESLAVTVRALEDEKATLLTENAQLRSELHHQRLMNDCTGGSSLVGGSNVAGGGSTTNTAAVALPPLSPVTAVPPQWESTIAAAVSRAAQLKAR